MNSWNGLSKTLLLLDTNFFLKILIPFVLFSLCLFYLSISFRPGSDYTAFLTGAEIIKNGEADLLYDIPTQIKYQSRQFQFAEIKLLPFRYPLPVALFFLPFTLVSPFIGFKIFVFINLIIVFLICYLIRKYIFNVKYEYLAAFFLGFIPVLYTFIQGQISLILALFITSIFISLKKRKYGMAGQLSVLLLFKPQYYLLVPFLIVLIPQKKIFIRTFIFSIFLIILFTAAIQGLRQVLYFPFFLNLTESAEFGSRYFANVTFTSFLLSLGLGSQGAIRIVNFTLYLLVLYLFYKTYRKEKFESYYAIAVLFTIFFSVHSLPFDLSLALLPIVLFAKKLLKSTQRYFSLILAVLLGLLIHLTANDTWVAVVLILPAIYFFRIRKNHSIITSSGEVA